MPKEKQSVKPEADKSKMLLSSGWAWFTFAALGACIIALWLGNAQYALTGELPFYLPHIEVPAPQPESLWERLGMFNNSQAVGSFAERGPTGDTFGIVNSLFAGLAFLGLFYAILLQREELSTVKAERDDTKEILRKQEVNIGAQTALLNKQAFETSFYNALDLLLKQRELLVHPGDSSIAGKEVLPRLALEIRSDVCFPDTPERLLNNYWTVDDNTPRSGSVAYIRFIMMICEMIQNLDIADREHYREALRCQLSDPDLVLIFFAVFSKENPTIAWRGLTEECNLLKYISLRYWDQSSIACIKSVYPGETVYL